jgi:sugar O-acyltransferase (sialic acid O-acetyltransferase NeuD family)
MIMKSIIIVGFGGHAKACLDVIATNPTLSVLGYLDMHKSKEESYDLMYLGTDIMASKFIRKSQFLITVGHMGNSANRIKLFQDLKKIKADFATVKAASAIVSKKSNIGPGTIVMHGAIIQADTRIGENCIVNDRVLIEHDSFIGNHCHISTGAILNGGVNIGNGTFIGSGSVIKNGITIGENCIVGMGSVVTKSIESGFTIYGNPANKKL